jgi:phosphate/sulfate permease
MALGTSIGGWRIMRTLGMRLTNLKTHPDSWTHFLL